MDAQFGPETPATRDLYQLLRVFSVIPRERDEDRVRSLDVQRAVCLVLQRHSQLLRMFLAEDSQRIYENLKALCLHRNPKV